MRVPRIFQTGEFKVGTSLKLDPSGFKHVSTVLRLKPGAPITIFNGKSGEFSAKLQSLSGREALVSIEKFVAREVESPLKIELAQAVSRGEKMDTTIQKAVELGISSIVPLLTTRCGVKLSDEKADKRHSRWTTIITSACEQSGRNTLPLLHPLVSFPEYLKLKKSSGTALLLLQPEVQSMKISQLRAAAVKNVSVLVGSEGGFSPEEVELALAAGYKSVCLGPRILRTETAALVALACIQAQLGDL